MTWRPIETAPLDGSDVIIAVWVSAARGAVEGWYVGEARYWHVWGEKPGWWWANTRPDDDIGIVGDAMFWQPLPEAPTKNPAEAGLTGK